MARVLILEKITTFELGMEYEIDIKFLNPKLATKNIKEGDSISLWEGKVIGKGIIKSIYQ